MFFDFEKAYDPTLRYDILRDLDDLCQKGRLPTFIESFRAELTIEVRVGSTLSDEFAQEEGVPQVSIFFTTLFNI